MRQATVGGTTYLYTVRGKDDPRAQQSLGRYLIDLVDAQKKTMPRKASIVQNS